MVRSFFYYMIVWLIPTICFANTNWDEFLARPTDENLTKLLRDAGLCKPSEVLMSPAAYRKLNKLTEEANENALIAGIRFSRCLGVADSEDFDRSAGLFFERNPKKFLNTAHKEGVTRTELKSMFRMLPENTVDDLDLQKKYLLKRLNILKGIQDSKFESMKKIGIETLEEEIKEIERIQRELKN